MWFACDIINVLHCFSSVFAISQCCYIVCSSDDPYEGTYMDSNQHNPGWKLTIITSINVGNLLDQAFFSGTSCEGNGTSICTPNKGRKMIRLQKLWKRNVRKEWKTLGKSYINNADGEGFTKENWAKLLQLQVQVNFWRILQHSLKISSGRLLIRIHQIKWSGMI